MRIIGCFSAACALVACSPDTPSQDAGNTGTPLTVAAQSSSHASASSLDPRLSVAGKPDGAAASRGFDGVVALWSRATGKEQDMSSEQEPASRPIKITPAAEVVNPFPPLRVAAPALAGKLAAQPRTVPIRAGDQAQARTLEKRAGDLVGRRAGDL